MTFKVNERRFLRRNIAGIEEFPSYWQSLMTRSAETSVMLLARPCEMVRCGHCIECSPDAGARPGERCMKALTVAITVAILTYMALAAYAALYLAGALYFVTLKTWPPALDANTFLSLWEQLGHLPDQRKKLQGCAGIAFIALYVVPLLIASQLSKRTRPLHGDARFARPGEIRQAGLHAEKGVIVGQADGDYLVFGGQQFVLLAAPTRSGKGVGVVIPNLLNWPDSVVVLDIKRENFGLTSGFRAQHGQAVYLFSPFDTEFKSHRWNPLDAVNRDPTHRVGDLMAIAATFWPSESGTDQLERSVLQ